MPNLPMETIKKSRKVIRQRTTVPLNKIEMCLRDENPDREALGELLEQLKGKNISLNQLNTQIQSMTDETDIEAEVDSAEDYAEKIIVWTARATKAITAAVVERPSEVILHETRTQERNSNRSATVKLPRLTIPKYNGDLAEWQNFWGQFEASIHENPTLAAVDKFTYLKSFLEGPALSAIGGYTLSEENYEAVIEKLTDRFGKRSDAINTHMVKLLHLQPVKRASDVTSLRHLYDTCEIQVKSLEALGTSVKTYGTFLYPILTQVLPHEILLEYNRRYDDEEQSGRTLLEYLKREVESRERATSLRKDEDEKYTAFNSRWTSNSAKNESSHSKHYRNLRNKPSTTAVLKTALSKSCMYCGDSQHPTRECRALSIDQKTELIKSQNRCFVCLAQGHMARRCPSGVRCGHCQRKHHESICRKQFEDQSEPKSISSESEDSSQPEKRTMAMSTIMPQCERDLSQRLLLQTVVAYAEGENSRVPVRCLFDGASEGTFIQGNLRRRLNLPDVKEEVVDVFPFGKEKPERVTRKRVKLTLRSTTNPEAFADIEALEVPVISGAMVTVPGNGIRRYMEDRNLPLSDITEVNGIPVSQEVLVLIGVDYFWALNTGENKRMDGSLVAVKSIFGWSVHGAQSTSLSVNSIQVMKVSVQETEIAASLKAFWEIESLGITEESVSSKSEDEVLVNHEKTLTFGAGRYTVRLPWKNSQDKIGSNMALSKRRLEGLVKKLKQDPVLYMRYQGAVSEMLDQGFAEYVPEQNIDQKEGLHYLPHFPVIRDDKSTTKLRIVHDASAHEKGFPSLNSCLHVGPSLVPDLLTILIQFRQYRIALMSDVEKAFLQIYLDPVDRDYVRFLWIKTMPKSDEPLEIIHLRMTRVLFGVASSPFLLAATLRCHFKKYEYQYPEISDMLAKRLYVDDLVTGGETVDEAKEVYRVSKEIFSHAGMNLRKWVTNCRELTDLWSEDSTPVKLLGKVSSSNLLKVLGMSWDHEEDLLTFDISSLLDLLKDKEDTKRGVLKAAARVFDPIGLLSPFLIRVKCLFQTLWVKGVGWDEKLPVEVQETWDDWIMELRLVDRVKVPRWYYAGFNAKVVYQEFHLFCDASELAYGAVLYLRHETEDGDIGVSLVSLKTRVAPIKALTIPRLELMAAVIGARLLNHTMQVFEGTVSSYSCWTDSEIVLHWIRGLSKQWKPFVTNRVASIQQHTEPSRWSHVAGKLNPADIASRGCHIRNLAENSLWWKGPPWLTEQKDLWPSSSKAATCPDEEIMLDERRKIVTLFCNLNPEPLLDVKRYSRINRIYRITAWIQRFIQNLKTNESSRQRGPLSATELLSAKHYWICEIQRQAYAEEYQSLSEKKPLSKTSKLLQFQPFLEDKVIRVGGRLQLATISYGLKHPYLLPADHYLTELIARNSHEMVKHGGLDSTLVQLRDEFWIPKGRQIVKKIVHHCGRCRRFRTKPGAQVPAPLPADRITESPPFATTGVDFAGPLFIRGEEGENKAYIALLVE